LQNKAKPVSNPVQGGNVSLEIGIDDDGRIED
jgi:hypothetical protein